MKHIRISPWLILVLASVLVFAAGCDRPDPQVAIDTPQPMTVPQQPVETPAPGGEAVAPGGEAVAPEGATPTLPPVVVATEAGAAEATVEGTPEAGGHRRLRLRPLPVTVDNVADSRSQRYQLTPQVNAQAMWFIWSSRRDLFRSDGSTM
jgi:hypothetical protein